MKRKVLIIDNNQAIRFLLQTVFAKTFEVITAEGGRPALDWLAKKQSPGLIVANSKLPDIHDWELVEYLASSRFYSFIPLIVLSDDSKEDTSSKCKLAGIKHFILKPFNPLELIQLADKLALPKEKTQYLV